MRKKQLRETARQNVRVQRIAQVIQRSVATPQTFGSTGGTIMVGTASSDDDAGSNRKAQ